MIFHCWDPDHGTEEDCRAFTFTGDTYREAAMVFAERRYGEDDYPETRQVSVRSDVTNTVRMFRITATPSIDFRSTELDAGGEPLFGLGARSDD